ncbi:MAG: polymer-forming cytoskeletal protein, partial [Actinomycetota bacterium]|nr:polymer-forming cytoskeletal protein [Actinomycetota bacterium]
MSIRGHCSTWSVKLSRSDLGSGGVRYRAVTFVALLFALGPLVAAIAPSVVTTDLFIVGEDDPISEDVYVASTSGRVEGLIDGDLVITTGDLSISGTVTGNVLALTTGAVRLEEGGVIEGSLRTVTPQVQVDGEIGGDLFVTGIGAGIGSDGVVGRDVIMFGGTLAIDGAVGRDARGRLLNVSVSGTVGRDVDLAVQRLVIDPGAAVDGDVLYRSTNDAVISTGTVSGQIVQLPAQSNFIFGVILTIANIVGFLAFVVSGIILFWLFRATGAAAVEAVEKHPFKTGLVGLGTLVGAPLLVLLLAVTLVGLPLAVLLMVALLLAFVFGPIPAVGAFGDILLRRKGGLFGGFVVGAVLWRLGI